MTVPDSTSYGHKRNPRNTPRSQSTLYIKEPTLQRRCHRTEPCRRTAIISHLHSAKIQGYPTTIGFALHVGASSPLFLPSDLPGLRHQVKILAKVFYSMTAPTSRFINSSAQRFAISNLQIITSFRVLYPAKASL